MGMFDTIKDLQNSTSREASGPRRQYLSLKDGDKFRIRFLQELAKDGKGYDEDAGTAFVTNIHVSPYDFKKKVACTIDNEKLDHRCWGCEQVVVDPKWRPKTRVLINVAVLDNGDWTSKVVDQTFSDSHIMSQLVEYASEYGSITDRDYNISRTGKGMNDTAYRLIPLDPKPRNSDIDSLELAELDSVYRVLPYDEQQEFFLEGAEKASTPASAW
jgi:hypothetical protein